MRAGLQMRSPRGFAGALVLLLGVPAALAAAALGASADITLHLALGASFLLLALSAFDFHLPRWIAGVCCAAMGLLAFIFLAQGVSNLIQSATLHRLAFDVLGQTLEKALGYIFLIWCLAVVVRSRDGVLKVLGCVTLAAVAIVEIYSFSTVAGGAPAPDSLKLLYLPLFVWLLLESGRPADAAPGT